MEVDLLPHNVAHFLLDGAILIGKNAEHQRHESAQRALEDRVGQCGFGSEVVVHQGLIHAGLIGDFLSAAVGRALPEEDCVSRVQDPFPGFPVGRCDGLSGS
jgi:hypothetical protein